MRVVVQDDVLGDGVADEADGVDDWGRAGHRDGAKIVCEGKDGPPVADGAEGAVFSIGEEPVRGELRTDGLIRPRLVRGPGRLTQKGKAGLSSWTRVRSGPLAYVQSRMECRTL